MKEIERNLKNKQTFHCSLFLTIMKRVKSISFLVIVAFIFTLNGYSQTIVEKYGQLGVKGNKVVDKNGNPALLRGMSLYWSIWGPQKYYNYNCIKWLRDDWHIQIIRACMAVENGGYLTDPATQKTLIDSVIDAAIKLGIYVIIDWHDDKAQHYTEKAQNFFVEMAQEYGNYPNIIYEPYNEPLGGVGLTWKDSIKPYLVSVINSIRQYDPYNLIICGTPTWSQDVDIASGSPIAGTNIAYTLHYYAATHKQWLRNKAATALKNGIALFVTEYGTCESSGSGVIDTIETRAWWKFLNQNKISRCNWSVADLTETSAILNPGASIDGNWDPSDIKPSGILVKSELLSIPDTAIPPSFISDNSINNNIVIFPNPVDEILYIKLYENVNQSNLNIYDNVGRLILRNTIEKDFSSINLKNLPGGFYLVKIISGNNIYVRKVLKR